MGKKYTDSVKLLEKNKLYDPAEALSLVCQTSKAKFDETIEIHVRLGVLQPWFCSARRKRSQCRKPS